MVLTDYILIVAYLAGVVAFSMKYRGASNFSRLVLLVGLMHLLASVAYFLFSKNNPADAVGYYMQARDATRHWFSYLGQDITFLVFLTFPLTQWLGLSYFGATLVYSFVGFFGFVFLIDVLRNVTLNQWSNWFYILLLPNLHFWTVAVGKDSIMFFAMSFLLYNIVFKKSWIYYILPIILTAYIRVHILVFAIVAYGVTHLFINKKMKLWSKIGLIAGVIVVMIVLTPMFAERLRIGEEQSLEQVLENFDSMKAMGGSGVDMQGKNIVVKWVSFMFRPLFFDVHSVLTLIASFENVFWLMMVYLMVRKKSKKIAIQMNTYYWMSVFMTLAVTIPSAYGLYNLGIAMRQKYMIFPFLVFAFFIAIHGVERKKILKKYFSKLNEFHLRKEKGTI